MDLQTQIRKVENVCDLIEMGEEYKDKLIKYLEELNGVIRDILIYAKDQKNSFSINEQFVLQVLKDIIYGIEHNDSVFLLDVLRYGLLEIYRYVADMMQNEEYYE